MQNPHADVEIIGAQHEDGVVEFARHEKRPPLRGRGMDASQVFRLRAGGRGDSDGSRAGIAIYADVDVAVVIAGDIDLA